MIFLTLIVGTGYKAVFGTEESIPTIDGLIQERRTSLLEEQKEIDMTNLRILSTCRTQQEKAKKATDALDQINVCYNKFKRNDIDIEAEMEKFTTWTVAPASSGVAERTKELEDLNKKVCDKKPSSPLCDKETFYRLYKITEERIPWKNFFPILLGITNAESSLGTAYAKNNKGWYCTWYNNLGWIKWKKTDEGKSVRDQKIPDANGCYLYKFESIDDYWISKVNTIRFWYKGCLNSKAPVKCMSYAYVWNPKVAEQSWINNVSIFLD